MERNELEGTDIVVNACPVCGSESYEGKGVEIENGTASQECSCNACNSVWFDYYILEEQDIIMRADLTSMV